MIEDALAPLDRLLRHEGAYWTTVARPEPRAGYLLFHNPDLPQRFDPNHAGVFRAPAGAAPEIVAEVTAFFRARGLPPVAYVDALATPSDLPDALLAAGYAELGGPLFGHTDLLVYVGPDREPAAEVPVEEVATAEGRADWAQVVDDEAAGEQRALLVRLHLAEASDPRVVPFLARAGGLPASRCLLFSEGGLGRVECVRTLAAHRGQGLAAAVVRAAVRASIAAGDRLTYLYAEQGGAAQRLYERLGFRTVARGVMRSFVLGG